MQFLQGLVSPQVYELAERSGAKIITWQAYCKMGPPLGDVLRNTFAAGFYSFAFDIIVVQPGHCAPQGFTVDEVVLHELIHWTGAKHRLRRKLMVLGANPRIAYKKFEGKELQAINKIVSTEELIAHAGMFELSSTLGLNMQYAEYSLNKYARGFPLGDMRIAANEAMRAARYLLSLAERRPLGVEEFLQSHIFMK